MFTITSSHENKDLLPGETLRQARDRYLEIWGDFKSQMPEPVVETHGPCEDRFVLRADKAPAGLKSFGAEKLVAECPSDTLVYVAPRVGHAPDAIATLAGMHGKRCVFFCPAAKEVSRHQRALLAHPHVQLKFVRIAAMPVLNKYAREWAEENGATFLPFGLTNTPVVTAGLVRLCQLVTEKMGGRDPSLSVCAVSTGTMIRALQIGWPDAVHYGVAVARNMHDGEVGDAWVTPHPFPFLRDERRSDQPPFDSTANYDAKAWSVFEGLDMPGSIFINVGSDAQVERNLGSAPPASEIDSARSWGDLMDLEV